MHGVDVDAIGNRGLVPDLDGGEEGELTDDLFAFYELELGILVPGIDFNACFEVLDSLLGLKDGSIGGRTAVVSLVHPNDTLAAA